MNTNVSLGTKCEIVNSNFATNIEIISSTTNIVITQIFFLLRREKKRHSDCFVILKNTKC